MKTQLAVMAGTAVDTAMGKAYLLSAGLEACGLPISQTAGEQMHFQVLPTQQRMAHMREIFAALQSQGVAAVFVYCNSLSAVVDFDALAQEFAIPVITPLQSYRAVAAQCSRVAVLAANCQSLAGIEKQLLLGRGDVEIYGAGMLPLVQAIEAERPPEALIAQFGLAQLLQSFAACGAQCLILGCTHFPYLKEALGKLELLPLYDPAEDMLARLRQVLCI